MTAAPEKPARSTRSGPWQRAELVALDFEATGLDFARDTIVSFGVVPIREGRVDLGGADYELVDPQGVRPSPESIVVHMLRPIDLAGAVTVDEARKRLRGVVDRRYLVTWFAVVEAAFLHKLFGGGTRRWIRQSLDVRKLVLALDRLDGTRSESYALADVAARFGVPVASPHHALDDALVTAQLFLIAATRLAAHGYATVGHLLAETTAEPPRLVRPRAPW